MLAGWRECAPQHVLPVSPSRPGRNSGRGRAGGMARSCPAARASGMVPGLKPRRRAYWRGGEKVPRSTPMRPRTSTTPLHGMPLLFTLHLSMCANRPVSRNDFITACEPSSLTSVDTLAFLRSSASRQPRFTAAPGAQVARFEQSGVARGVTNRSGRRCARTGGTFEQCQVAPGAR